MGAQTFIFDRVLPWTAIYALTTAAIYGIRPYLSDLITLILFAATTLYFAQTTLHHLNQERRILSRGKQAAVVRTWTPFNIGFIRQALSYFSQHRNHELWWKLFKIGNPARPYTVEAVVLGQRLVFTADEENIKAILATKFQDYGKGPQFRKEWKDFLGLSIFTTDGQQWHDSRTLLRPQFIKDRVSDLDTFEHHAQILLPMLGGTYNGATVRFDDLIYRYTLDAATDFLLGKSVESLQNGEAEFATAFAEVQHVQAVIARAGMARHFVPKKSFYASLKVLNQFVDTYIDRALALPKDELEKKSKSDEGYTFLHAIATYTRDRAVLRDQLMAVLLAGRDTTATSLSWLFYELSKQPQVVQKLREEIIGRVGLERVPTYDDLKAMRYLQHSLNEVLRLYPVVPYNVRVALQDTVLPHGGGADGMEPIGKWIATFPIVSKTAAHHLTFSL